MALAHAVASARDPEEHDQRAHGHPDDPRHEKAAEQEYRQWPRPPLEGVEPKRDPGQHSQNREDNEAPDHPDQPGARGQVADADGRQELVFHRLAPHVEEDGVGHVELAHLDGGERNGSRQNEGRVGRTEGEKARQQPDGKHAHHRPENQLEGEEDVP